MKASGSCPLVRGNRMGLMKLSDLAERWGLSEGEVKDLIREGASPIPFIRLGGGGGMRINWNRVRFRPESIENWESQHQTVFKEAKPSRSTGKPQAAQKLAMKPGPIVEPGCAA